jgi:hypothetical protein
MSRTGPLQSPESKTGHEKTRTKLLPSIKSHSGLVKAKINPRRISRDPNFFPKKSVDHRHRPAPLRTFSAKKGNLRPLVGSGFFAPRGWPDFGLASGLGGLS